MKDNSNPTHRDQAKAALSKAEAAARRGDQRAAENWSKIAERMAAAERIAATPEPPTDHQEAERIRAELRARVARFVGVAHEIQAWEKRRDIRDGIAAYARAHNLPEPPELEPCPYDNNDLEALGAGTYEPKPYEPPHLRALLGVGKEEEKAST